MCIGAPAGGINAAVRIAGRLCLNRGYTPIGIHDGFSGLVDDKVRPLIWSDLTNIQVQGGSFLGMNRDHPRPLDYSNIPIHGITEFVDLGQIAFQLQKHKIEALMIIGGFEAFTSTLTLARSRHFSNFYS